MSELLIEKLDTENAQHLDHLLEMLQAYAMDPMGLGRELSSEVLNRVRQDFRDRSNLLAFIAYYGGAAAGVAFCIESYSTFKGLPVINVHDLCVREEHRGRGIGSSLLKYVVSFADANEYAKVTLEVRADNTRAHSVYQTLGFRASEGDKVSGMYFWERTCLK